jgi:hypothetical protein
VRFELVPGGGEAEDFGPKLGGDGSARRPARGRDREPSSGGRFSVRGRRGLNRLRFSGRVRGHPLAAGAYVLTAVAVDRAGRRSAPASVRFRIGFEGS